MRPLEENSIEPFSVPLEVANDDDVTAAFLGLLETTRVRRITLQGVVHPRKAKLVLPKAVADQLGLRLGRKVKVRYANGRSATRLTAYGAHVTLHGREGVFSAIIEPKRTEARIGFIVLNDLDLLVDHPGRRLVPRDPRSTVYDI